MKRKISALKLKHTYYVQFSNLKVLKVAKKLRKIIKLTEEREKEIFWVNIYFNVISSLTLSKRKRDSTIDSINLLINKTTRVINILYRAHLETKN